MFDLSHELQVILMLSLLLITYVIMWIMGGFRIRALERRLKEALIARDHLDGQLLNCAKVFDQYALNHQLKRTPEGQEKAQVNRAQADACYETSAKWGA